MQSTHFTDAELRCHGTNCCGGRNNCQQRLVDGLEALRAIVGVPIIVNDAYRCPVHNAAVGGVSHSQHEEGLAADIVIHGMTPAQMYRAALQVPAFAGGGIGVAEHQDYVHVDCRAGKARWCYGTDGQQCEWNSQLDAMVQV